VDVPQEREIRAAGGVVRRPAGDHVELLLVHRPRYGDWALPKGKLEPGESEEEAALREVEEETGFLCELEGELGTNSYTDAHGQLKTVRYFAMKPVSGAFRPSDEVDEIRWARKKEAESLLSYQGDRRILQAL
jgi:8-oxo-dGTP diphosphatase